MAEFTSSFSASTYKPRYIIDKLNGTNYQVWKIRMELYLTQLQLWDVTSGIENQPDHLKDEDSTSLDDTYDAWHSKNNSAKMELILHCQDRQVQMVKKLTTANAIWKFFEKNYEHTDLVYQVSLIKKLVNTTMQEGQSSSKFLETWQILLDEVLVSGLAIPEELQSMLLLASLPASWRAFITTQATTANLQLQNLVAKIHREETLRDQTNSSQKSTALVTTTRNSRPYNGKKPHYSGPPRQHNSGSKSQSQSLHNHQNPKQCANCHRFGHLTRNCRKPRNQGNRPIFHPNFYPSYPQGGTRHGQPSTSIYGQAHYADISTYDNPSYPLQLYATTIATSYLNIWLLDTDATHHMTYHLHWLSNITYLEHPLEKMKIMVMLMQFDLWDWLNNPINAVCPGLAPASGASTSTSSLATTSVSLQASSSSAPTTSSPGTASAGSRIATLDMVDQWHRNHHRVYSFLLINCTDNVLTPLRSHTTAHEVWAFLCNMYEAKTPGRIPAPGKSLMDIDFLAFPNLWDFISRMLLLRDELTTCGLKISLWDMEIRLLLKLPIPYEALF
ncbi:hypothetical protein L7F22_034053 [Adiantum nelumboides]|nr:hypothetical protein [Adiantum nelumboides]